MTAPEQRPDQLSDQDRDRVKLMELLPFYGIEEGASEEARAFVDELRRNRVQVLQRIDDFLSKPSETGEAAALKVYLHTTVKAHVFDIDTLTGESEEASEARLELAFTATGFIAQNWLQSHPDSKSAQEIANSSIFASSGTHYDLLQELWPTLCHDYLQM